MTVVEVADARHKLGFVVADDYFAIGTPEDHVRVPLDPLVATEIGDKLGFTLPTARMVDLVWQAAAVKLKPITAPEIGIKQGSAEQDAPPAFWKHDAAVTAQLAGRSGLAAGQKKDVILDNRLGAQPNRVAIYGWHKAPGSGGCQNPTIPGLCPIQGVSLVHENTYRDYSHGVRMVSPLAMLDGESVTLVELLTSPTLGPILNHGAPLKVLRQPGGAPPPKGGGSCMGIAGPCPSGTSSSGSSSSSARKALGWLLGLAGAAAIGWAGWEAWRRHA